MSKLNQPAWLVLFIGLILVVAVWAIPADVFARAGGGGSFSGGGGGGGGSSFSSGGSSFSSGGGGSSSGGGGEMTPGGMAFLVIVVIAIVIAKLLSESAGSASIGHVSTRPRLRRKPVSFREIEKLRRTDANFDLDAFLHRFKTAFRKIQAAWSAQDLSDVKHFMSDRVFERFSLQLQEQQDLGYRNVVEQVKIFTCNAAEIDTSSMFDVLTVCVTASAVDYRVSLRDGSVISGNPSRAEQFTEYWTLIRRHGTQSVESRKSLFEGHCPNCGADVHLNRLGNCESCDSVIRSGEYDWVLSEITQASVWKPLGRDQLALANEYRNSADPGFSIHHLTDRASVIFWRRAMADRLGDLAPLSKVATDEFCAATAPKLTMQPEGRRYLGNCSVGSLSMVGVLRDQDADRALVEVQFSAHDFRQARDGAVSDLGNWRRIRRLMVLRRNKGVTSNVSHSLNSANCPSCGAPETDLVSHACEFCGEVLNQGRFDWVLEQFPSWGSAEARRWRERLRVMSATRPTIAAETIEEVASGIGADLNPLDGLAWVIKMLTADGKMHEQEKQQLVDLAGRNSISLQTVQSMLSDERSADLDAPDPPDVDTARRWLGDMTDMALVDGEISREEKRVLIDVGRASGLVAYDINLVIAKRRALALKQQRHQQGGEERLAK